MAPGPISYASAHESRQEDKSLRELRLEGSVVLKIVKHCQESQPSLVTGQLLGLDIGSSLEVTDCFPFPSPSRDEDEDPNAEGANYQLEMMRCLREINVDNNTVGWYQSTIMGSFQTLELIETFINYQESIKRCICIIYDPQRTKTGSLKAVKLRERFIEVYKAGPLTMEKLKAANLAWNDVFEELPIRIQNGNLARALLASIEPSQASQTPDFGELQLGSGPMLLKTLDFMNEFLDDTVAEQQKVSFYHRNVGRQQAQQSQWLQKRKQENAQRRAAGEEPLPEEDLVQFKPIPEPSPLDGYLLNNQISNCCDQMHQFSTRSLQKLHLVESLQSSIVHH